MSRRWLVALAFGFLCVPLVVRGGDWPGFRGPDGAAQSSEAKLPSEWDKEKNVLWKAKIPGYAWSQPVVWGDKVFVTTAVSEKQRKPSAGGGRGGFGRSEDRPEAPKDQQPRERPKDQPGGFQFQPGGRGGRIPDAVYKWEVHCLDRTTGKELWHQVAAEKKPTISTHSSNTYASETPVTDGERVYAYFGMTGVYCFDFAGKKLWEKDLGSYKMMAGWGTGSSPVLDGDRLFIQCDNDEKSFLVALDKKTGKELWKVNRDEKSSWSTPLVWRNKKRTEVVCCGHKVRSYDPATGKVLWELGGLGGGGRGGAGGAGGPGGRMGGGNRADTTPVASDELIYVGSSGSFSSGPLLAVKAGASGDITLKDGATSNEGVAWSVRDAGPSMASALLYNGHLYVLEQRRMLSCFDAKTGKEIYRKERLQARSFTSSPWAYDGKIFCLDESGQTLVFKAGPKFEMLGKNKLDEMCWASPAVSHGALFLRTVDYLYCIK